MDRPFHPSFHSYHSIFENYLKLFLKNSSNTTPLPWQLLQISLEVEVVTELPSYV